MNRAPTQSFSVCDIDFLGFAHERMLLTARPDAAMLGHKDIAALQRAVRATRRRIRPRCPKPDSVGARFIAPVLGEWGAMNRRPYTIPFQREISTSLVSRRNKVPMMSVITETTTVYHRPK